MNPLPGAVDQCEELRHTGGVARLVSPADALDVALRVVRRGGIAGETVG